ncbi:hypothetical protein TNIN_354621 [Trichonephila inaurata madagascariensis]|uniref:Uncharacterized protein n=1 Tax=Trichonephila inaurata madagascariensis TaxID=2747483 RepID=A0A8X6JRQ8_9ARAC|nr:hypothetical protein TNIN_354621 [Trichonephila inaurata madagascariensis]
MGFNKFFSSMQKILHIKHPSIPSLGPSTSKPVGRIGIRNRGGKSRPRQDDCFKKLPLFRFFSQHGPKAQKDKGSLSKFLGELPGRVKNPGQER